MTRNPNILEQLIASDTSLLSKYTTPKDRYKVQILYTRIDRDGQNRPSFRDYSFNLNPDNYFYPASTVKMPIAFLAAQKCRALGIPITAAMFTDSAFDGQTASKADTTAPGGVPSIAHYIKKIFLVSDNDASNRLYEFLGQEYILGEMQRLGFNSADIRHRLAIVLSEEQNRHTNPVSFWNSDGRLIYKQPEQVSGREFPVRKDLVGKGYMMGEELISEPMDFSRKNRISLEDLHRCMQKIIFPERFTDQSNWKLSDSDYRYLYHCMSLLPRESGIPAYSTSEYYDGYVKFFLYGTQKETHIPDHIRIFNKVGWAYGFLTDVAYIVDFQNKVEFLLSATIYCNEDEILNDDRYDYDEVGLPFLEKLGHVIYHYELNRTKKHLPDLTRFKDKP